jgi:signal peptidase I
MTINNEIQLESGEAAARAGEPGELDSARETKEIVAGQARGSEAVEGHACADSVSPDCGEPLLLAGPTTEVAHAQAAEMLALPVAVGLPEAEPARSHGSIWPALREVAETVILTLVIFLLVRAVMENYLVIGTSMEPNLHSGEYLIVNKVLYTLQPSERGDIIVFRAPKSPDKNFVKRIIALPGESVELRRGQVYINGKLLYEPYIDPKMGQDWGPAIVGPNELFVLGDNRGDSSDSRSWGMLPVENIIGKAWICYWPPSNWGFLPHYALALK